MNAASIGVTAAALAVIAAGVLVPGLRSDPRFLALMHLSLGALIALAVGKTVAGFARPSTYPVPVTAGRAAHIYRSQKRVGFVLSVLLAILLGYGVASGRFARMGGWLLLPVVFIAPVLHLRDARRRGPEGDP